VAVPAEFLFARFVPSSGGEPWTCIYVLIPSLSLKMANQWFDKNVARTLQTRQLISDVRCHVGTAPFGPSSELKPG
jgi:hypothetical protein